MTTHRVLTIQLADLSPEHSAVRAECARLWNRMVRLHRWFRQRRLPWPTCAQFEKHFKRRFALHSQTIQAVIQRFFANIETTRTNRAAGDRAARYPHRLKSFMTPVWKDQAIKVRGNRLILPMGKGRRPLRVRIPALLPGKIAKVELGFGELYVTLTLARATRQQSGTGVAAGDLGVIHTVAMTDGRDSLAVVGRGLRSVVQGHNKAKAQIVAQLARCTKGSRRWKKLRRALGKRRRKTRNIVRNLLHHASNVVREFVQERSIGTFHVGDVTELNRGKAGKRSRRLNQETGNVPLGQFVAYLDYKLAAIGCELRVGDEAYTSQTCPRCLARTKPKGRIYRCRGCGFSAPRDQVGSWNFLNKSVNGCITPGAMVPNGKLKYLRPVAMRKRRRSNGVVPVTPAMLLGKTSVADGVHREMGETLGVAASAA